MKQVEKEHYRFTDYMTKKRWASIWHQIDEVNSLDAETVLEVGPGLGVFKSMAASVGLSVETLDIDPDLNPDYVGSAEALPFKDNSFDAVCCFQVLEHFSYNVSLSIFQEMARVSRKYLVVSIPDIAPLVGIQINIPKVRTLTVRIPWNLYKVKKHVFDGEHYWELNKKGYALNKVVYDLKSISGATLKKTYRVPENPYHRFFVFEVC